LNGGCSTATLSLSLSHSQLHPQHAVTSLLEILLSLEAVLNGIFNVVDVFDVTTSNTWWTTATLSQARCWLAVNQLIIDMHSLLVDTMDQVLQMLLISLIH
jgi:hypothetical protein